MGATKKICTFILETENCAKSYFRNCPNYRNCLNPEIIGGHYFTETHKNKYIKISDKSKNTAKTTLPNSTKFSQVKLTPISSVLA